MREASQASAYLSQALESLGEASNPVALFRRPPGYIRDSLLEPAQRQLTARNRRLNFLRNAVLFAALAVEAYANEFNAAVLSPADAHASDRLPLAEKLLLGSRIAGVDAGLDRGAQPFQGLASLQQVRNAVVHPHPGGVSTYIQNVDLEDQKLVGPRSYLPAWCGAQRNLLTSRRSIRTGGS